MFIAPQSSLPDTDTPEGFLEHWVVLLRSRIRELGLRPREVAARLHVGESSLRKRLRGEVPFSAWEFVTLSSWLELPSCARDLARGRLQLTASLQTEGAFDAGAYIGAFAAFNRKATVGIPRERIRLRICATDLPIHQILSDPVLTALKLYFFATDSGVEVARRFDLGRALETQAAILAEAEAVHAGYQAVDSVEVWGRDPLESLLAQVALLARVGALTDADASVVFERLRSLATRVCAEADTGRKTGGGAFRLYQHDLFSNNAILLVENGEAKLSFLTVANPQFLHSDHERTHEFLSATAEDLRRQARPVTGGTSLDGDRMRERLLAGVARTEAAVKAFWAAEAMF